MSFPGSNIEKKTAQSLLNGQNCKDQRLMQGLWRGSQVLGESIDKQSVTTGYSSLNQLLVNCGWPLGVTAEIGLSQSGIGELRLITPALNQLQQISASKRKVIFVAPPLLPTASGLLKEGLQIEHLIIVQPDTVSGTVWACEQALLTSSCAAVICWTGRYQLSSKESRRLQMAAEENRVLHVLFRDSNCLQQSSASRLRLSLQVTTKSELDIHILKQPNHWGGQRCTLSLHPHYEEWQRLPASLLPQHNRPYHTAINQRIATANSSDQRIASITALRPELDKEQQARVNNPSNEKLSVTIGNKEP